MTSTTMNGIVTRGNFNSPLVTKCDIPSRDKIHTLSAKRSLRSRLHPQLDHHSAPDQTELFDESLPGMPDKRRSWLGLEAVVVEGLGNYQGVPFRVQGHCPH